MGDYVKKDRMYGIFGWFNGEACEPPQPGIRWLVVAPFTKQRMMGREQSRFVQRKVGSGYPIADTAKVYSRARNLRDALNANESEPI